MKPPGVFSITDAPPPVDRFESAERILEVLRYAEGGRLEEVRGITYDLGRSIFCFYPIMVMSVVDLTTPT